MTGEVISDEGGACMMDVTADERGEGWTGMMANERGEGGMGETADERGACATGVAADECNNCRCTWWSAPLIPPSTLNVSSAAVSAYTAVTGSAVGSRI